MSLHNLHMRHHVAILHKRYLALILNGTKTIESRITRGRLAPWGCISRGDIIHFKQSCGPFMARAIAAKIHSFDNLTPEHVQHLQTQFGSKTLGPQTYWNSKQHCKYATFIQLKNVTPITAGPVFPRSYGLAWFVLDAHPPAHAPNLPANTSHLQIILTAGALKNRYLPAPASLPQGPVTLLLPDHETLHTHITPEHRFATRKWAAYFKKLQPGDVACFVPQGNKRYRVTFITDPSKDHD